MPTRPKSSFSLVLLSFARLLKKLGPTGDVMLHEKLNVKYAGLKLNKNEGYHRIFTVHEVQFVRETRRKYYRIVVVLKEFDTAISLDNNDEDHYDFWDFCLETYNCFCAYYDLYAKEGTHTPNKEQSRDKVYVR